ncbi:uncharacterized protein LOC111704500 [Eurytemora carolleeae]|uniref:uncharacterized protein LOC111704500 n=1 Tax=Eurytemora carolleeae TaxID=1294199 RepID=UPI000C75C09B|nr:uncharacterized protein LOC111704500 [Eurytemora carolleeae]|eukprot:XP_023332514.1 uncharacterized protein LOC111704500 [Eurytemora affinis]
MFLPKSRQMTAMGREGVFIEDHDEDVSDERIDTQYHQYRTVKPKPLGSVFSKWENQNDAVYQNGSYLGFHRPLGVIPPSSSPPSYRHAPGPWSDSPPQYQDIELF